MIKQNARDIEHRETFLNNLDIQDQVKDDLENFKNIQIKYYTDKEVILNRQIQLIDSKLKNFETEFFEGI